jgi:predicted nucleic acid-binding protein
MILDASVWLASDDADDGFFESSRELILSGRSLKALDLTIYEIVNALAKKQGDPASAIRMSKLVLKASDPGLIRLDSDSASSTAEVVGETGLSGYDAAYVSAARQAHDHLVSVDLRHLVRPGHAITPAEALDRLHKDQPPQ